MVLLCLSCDNQDSIYTGTGRGRSVMHGATNQLLLNHFLFFLHHNPVK